MDLQHQWADRGQLLQLDAPEGAVQGACLGVSRLGSAQLSSAYFSIWLQIRGSSTVEAKEGRFQLNRGDWIALEKDSKPVVQAQRHGLTLGLALTSDALRVASRVSECALYSGRGRLDPGEEAIVMRLWRQTAARHEAQEASGQRAAVALRPLMLQLADIQHDLNDRIQRCPGRSRTRKRQVFGRLQRARLYLEGHSDRIVRISELAELTNFSSWYFSKTFHSLYEEAPQTTSVRLRLERAAELLVSTSFTIGEVAAACGFDNCCSFARAFRSHHGASATQYRSRETPSSTKSAKSPGARRKAS